jgi:hypothetical protein
MEWNEVYDQVNAALDEPVIYNSRVYVSNHVYFIFKVSKICESAIQAARLVSTVARSIRHGLRVTKSGWNDDGEA